MVNNPNRTPTDPWRIDLTYQHRQRWWFTGGDEPEAWEVSADLFDDSGTHRLFHVGDSEIVRVDLDQTPDAFAVLDGEDAILGRIAEIVLDPATGRLDPALDALEPLGSRLLILKIMRLTPEWRDFGLGILLAGIAIKKLAGGVRAAVCDPIPLPDPQDADVGGDRVEQAVVTAGLSEWLGQLGFGHFRDGVHVLDLNLVTLEESLERLRKRAEQWRTFEC